MAFIPRMSFSLTLNHVDQPLDPDRVLHSHGEWFSVLSWVFVSHWKLINYLEDLLGHRVLGPRPEYVSASICRIYFDIVFLVPDQNTLEAHRGPSHMLGAFPWHQPTWSQTKKPQETTGGPRVPSRVLLCPSQLTRKPFSENGSRSCTNFNNF